jgi:hypothetical protein
MLSARRRPIVRTRTFCERRDGRDEMAEIPTQAPVQALPPRSRDPNRWQIVEPSAVRRRLRYSVTTALPVCAGRPGEVSDIREHFLLKINIFYEFLTVIYRVSRTRPAGDEQSAALGQKLSLNRKLPPLLFELRTCTPPASSAFLIA